MFCSSHVEACTVREKLQKALTFMGILSEAAAAQCNGECICDGRCCIGQVRVAGNNAGTKVVDKFGVCQVDLCVRNW